MKSKQESIVMDKRQKAKKREALGTSSMKVLVTSGEYKPLKALKKSRVECVDKFISLSV